jgi:hypothetical protein
MWDVRVVAPTSRSPRAKAGFIICPPSMLPSVFPKLKRVSGGIIVFVETYNGLLEPTHGLRR